MTVGEGIFYSVLLIFCALPAGIALVLVALPWLSGIVEEHDKRLQKRQRERDEQLARVKRQLKP